MNVQGATIPQKKPKNPHSFPQKHPQEKTLFVIIVHYGPRAQAEQAVAALRAGSLFPEHIIVIDHARKAVNITPQAGITCIRPEKNLGYGAGINRGLMELQARHCKDRDAVIIMNSDVIVHHNTVQSLNEHLLKHPQEAVVGVTVREKGVQEMGLRYVNLWTGRTCLSVNATAGFKNFWRLPYLHGAFFAAPLHTLIRAGKMPEAYFIYWEDVVFSIRVQKLGIPIFVVSTVTVDHADEKDTAHKEQQLYYLVRNGAYVLEHHTPGAWRLYWRVANRIRLLYHTVKPGGDDTVREALRDALRGKMGQREAV